MPDLKDEAGREVGFGLTSFFRVSRETLLFAIEQGLGDSGSQFVEVLLICVLVRFWRRETR